MSISAPSRRKPKRYLLAIVVTIALCTVWGLAHGFWGFVIAPFSKLFAFSTTQRYLVSLTFPLTYVIAAIPAAMLLRRLGYKLGIISGLSAFSLGAFLFYPALSLHQPLYVAAAVIATGAGWSILETAVNPLICQMGSPQTAVLRLNFAQAFYPAGYLVAFVLGGRIPVPPAGAMDAHTVETFVRPYVVVGLVLLFVAFLFENVEYPPVAVARSQASASTRAEMRTLLAKRDFRLALVAMCAMMTGLVSVMSFAGKYIAQVSPAEAAYLVPNVAAAFWIVAGIGRFAGTALMLRISPVRLLSFAAGACTVSLCLALAFDGIAGVAGLGCSALFLSIMFPTIFAIAVADTGDMIKPASGLVVAAAGMGSILSGNITNWAVTAGLVHLAVAVAAVCFAIVFAAVRQLRQPF